MDISEQVDKLLRDTEVREKKSETERRLVEAAFLEELGKQYKQCVINEQWKTSYDCLAHICQLVISILDEPAGK